MTDLNREAAELGDHGAAPNDNEPVNPDVDDTDDDEAPAEPTEGDPAPATPPPPTPAA